MKNNRTFLTLGVAAAGMLLLLCACKKSADNPVVPPTIYQLTLTLDPALNGPGTQFISSITKAVLLNGNGDVVKTATGSGASVQFELTGVIAADYFIEINDLADAMLPVRIKSIAKNITQTVGMTLDDSFVYSGSDTLYRIKTYSKGQGAHPLVKYSDGTNVTPESYMYAILSLMESPPRIEMYTFNDQRMVLLQVKTAADRHKFQPWMLGHENHGIGADSVACVCHKDLIQNTGITFKADKYTKITDLYGFCYKCHYGPTGTAPGFIDPAK